MKVAGPVVGRGRGRVLVLEQSVCEVDVVKRVGYGALRLRFHVGLHARHAVVRHLLREVLLTINQKNCEFSLWFEIKNFR